MKKFTTAVQRHRRALQKARLVIPETAEVLLADFMFQQKLTHQKHDFSLLCTHIEPEQACCYFDFAVWYCNMTSAGIRNIFQSEKEKLQKNSARITGRHGSSCTIKDLYFLSLEPSPAPASGNICFGRVKVDLNLSSFCRGDAPIKISEDWNYLGAEDALNEILPCHLKQIVLDFGQEPELLFTSDCPLEKEPVLPDFMVLQKFTSQTLLVRLAQSSYAD